LIVPAFLPLIIGSQGQHRFENELGLDFDNIFSAESTLPVCFDLRGTNRLSPVRTQPTGACWASAAMSSVESFWRTKGFSNQILSDLNLNLYHGFDSIRNGYGNHFMATAYLTRGSGPVIKSSRTDSLKSNIPGLPVLNVGARFLPNNAPLIKQIIKDYGAVWSMMYFRKPHFDTITDIWYTEIRNINHVIDLVGWNDTMQTKTGEGCWIAQNSLGRNFGDEGFFYIPYSDPNILQYNAVWQEWIPWHQDNGLLYYDTLGSTSNYGFNDTVCYGLVKFTAPCKMKIDRFGSYISLPGTIIRAEVYEHFDTTLKTLTGLIGSANEMTCRFAGYYTIKLLKEVEIKQNRDFYVMMQYSHPTDTMPLPVEKSIAGYSHPHLTSGRCWVNPDIVKWSRTWYPCGTTSLYSGLRFDLCIRVYYRKAD